MCPDDQPRNFIVGISILGKFIKSGKLLICSRITSDSNYEFIFL